MSKESEPVEAADKDAAKDKGPSTEEMLNYRPPPPEQVRRLFAP
jgi:hypothetical protein